VVTTFVAIITDTVFYSTLDTPFLLDALRHPVIAPLNSLLYNTQSANLALHGVHPRWQHFLVNLPQLLGPATLLLLTCPILNTNLVSAGIGTLVLSTFPHQEARFLLPVIPLILSSVRLPTTGKRVWIASWIVFNCIFGLLMGVYHQGGIVETQAFLRVQNDIGRAFWWKTYSPPTWILGKQNGHLQTIDLMGLQKEVLVKTVCGHSSIPVNGTTILIAPQSATFLDQFQSSTNATANGLALQRRWSIKNHLNLDDMDFGDDGLIPTLSRVIGRRGITIFDVSCFPTPT
jgi:phosphatidylinositol glycan class Z